MAVLGEGNTCFYHLIYELVLSDSLAATKRWRVPVLDASVLHYDWTDIAAEW
jgi:hypothetical protein